MTDETKIKMMEALAKSGMSVGQFIMENTGTITYNDNRCSEKKDKPKVTEEIISRALIAINGKEKAVDSQRAWLGVCCLLGWKYDFPRNLADCCNSIKALGIDESLLEFKCKYDSIRMYGSWKFLKEKYEDWPSYTPRDDERQMFQKCLAVAQALDKEIEKQTELEL